MDSKKTTDTAFDFTEILDYAMKDIAARLAKLNISVSPAVKLNTYNGGTLVITTKGDYHLTFLLHGDMEIFRMIAQNMKREGSIDKKDIEIYMTEFYNVLCGKIVSTINEKLKCRTYFGVPLFYASHELPKKQIQCNKEHYHTSYYCCNGCTIKMETFGIIKQ